MTRDELIERNLEFLSGIKDVFTEAGLDPEVDDIGNVEMPQSIVCEFNSGLNNDQVLGQFYWLPEEGDTDVSYLVQTVTLVDDIEGDERKIKMLQAINLLNNQVPYGMFMLDPSLEMLQYRYVIPVSSDLDKAEAKALIDHEIFTGLGIVSTYVAPLITLLDETIDWDDFQHILAEYNAQI